MAERVCPISRPEEFSEGIWENICKTPLTDVLLNWLAQQLVNQDIQKIVEALTISKTPTNLPQSSNDWKMYSVVLSSWLQDRGSKTTYLSELVFPLAPLKIKALSPSILFDKTSDLCDQGGDFKFFSGTGMRSDSGISESTITPWVSSPPDPFTADKSEKFDGIFAVPIQEEETALRVFSQLVTGGPDESLSQPTRYTKVDRSSIRSLRMKLRELQNKFAILLQHTCSHLFQNKASVSDLRVFLTQRCADKHNKIPYFSSFMVDIMKKSTFEEIFVHLSRIGAWHFLDYLLLKDIQSLFQGYLKIKSQIDEYDKEIEAFKKETLLIEFLAVWGGRCDKDEDYPGYRSVIIKAFGDPNSFTIADACEMAGLIAGEFSLRELGILANGLIGSIYIKWLVPASVSRCILKMMKRGKLDLLQFGVLQLAVERSVFKSKYRYESIYKLSLNNPQLFWAGVGAKELVWRKHSREVFTHDNETGEFHWFKDAELNVSENCLDEHVKCNPDRVAIVWERDDEKTERVTYRQLLEQTCRVANVLKKKGIKKGDVVVICMPAMPLAVASMLACARIGAVHCMLFSDFNDDILHRRIKEVQAKAVITADIQVIGGETKKLKKKIVRVLSNRDTRVEIVLVAKRSTKPEPVSMLEKGFSDGCRVGDAVNCCSLELEMEKVSSKCDPLPMGGEDFLFIAYTSGTEKGTSKAVYHIQAGFLLYTRLTHKFTFNLGPDDIMGCVSDLGWIAAHLHVVYGPLSCGNTTLLFESTATYPDEGRYWKMVEKLNITHFYTIPSVLKKLMIKSAKGAGPIDKYDLTSLKVIAAGGEPIPPEIEEWYLTEVGRGKCLFIDDWGQTELGGAGIVRWKSLDDQERADFPSSKSFALFGVEWNKDEDGVMYLKRPLPAMGKFILPSGSGQMKPYEHVYYSKVNGGYSTSDILEGGQTQFRVIGRKDRALLVKGVWLSLADMEEQLRTHMSDAKKDIQDVQVILPKYKPGFLFIVLQTPTAVNHKQHELLSVIYTTTLSAPLIEKITAEGFTLQIYIFSMPVESMKKYLQTISRKTCHIPLEKFLARRTQHQLSPKKCEIIDEAELREFFQVPE